MDGRITMMRLFKKIIVITLFSVFFIQPAFALEVVSVFVSIVPQKFFVQQIGRNLVDVHFMVQPGASPHTYEPRPQQMIAIAGAKLYFAVGVEFEKAWLKKIAAANPKMKVVHTDHGIKKIPMTAHHHHDEEKASTQAGAGHKTDKQDHKGHHHENEGLDPHIWLSPPLVKIQARAILKALQETDPSNRTVYETNYHRFVSQIDELDRELQQTFAGKKGLRFMVFHPAWGYFAHAYGLKQVSIEVEGKDPKPAELKELIAHAREDGVKVVFVQPQFSAKSAEVVAREIGGQVAFVNPLAEDWLANLREVADKFKAALK